MSFYPLLTAPGCRGWTTVCNFPPNNWETRDATEKFINVTWFDESVWKTTTLGLLKFGEMKTFRYSDVAGLFPEATLPLFWLSGTKPPTESKELPAAHVPTHMPAWRGSLGLENDAAQTSYQGELDPFPATGSLLTFCPFLQYGEGLENYLLLMNVESLPIRRKSQLEIFNPNGNKLMSSVEVTSNYLNMIRLDGLGFGPADLPLLMCREMTGIPLFFSKTSDGSCLSLEHTHPPASLVIHGQRWQAQKILKDRWFSLTR